MQDLKSFPEVAHETVTLPKCITPLDAAFANADVLKNAVTTLITLKYTLLYFKEVLETVSQYASPEHATQNVIC